MLNLPCVSEAVEALSAGARGARTWAQAHWQLDRRCANLTPHKGGGGGGGGGGGEDAWRVHRLQMTAHRMPLSRH